MERIIVIVVVLIVNFFQNAMSCGVEANNSAKLRIIANGVLQPIELSIDGRLGKDLQKAISAHEAEEVWNRIFPPYLLWQVFILLS